MPFFSKNGMPERTTAAIATRSWCRRRKERLGFMPTTSEVEDYVDTNWSNLSDTDKEYCVWVNT